MFEIYKKTLTNAFKNVKTYSEVNEQEQFMSGDTAFDYGKQPDAPKEPASPPKVKVKTP